MTIDKRLLGNCSLVPDRTGLEELVSARQTAASAAVDELWPAPDEADKTPTALAQRVILRKFGRSLRKQGGIVLVGDTDGLSDEDAVLFHVAGFPWLTVMSHGDCTGCVHSFDGRERGYNYPCVSCTRPSHSHYQGPDDAEPYDICELREAARNE